MRKGLAYCGAAAIAAAGSLYLAAGYASDHPHALISKCLIAGYVVSTHDLLSSRVGTIVCDDRPVCSGDEARVASTCGIAGNGEDPEQFRVPGRIDIEEEAARAPTAFPLVFEESEEPALLVPIVREQAAPRYMPFACDDEESPARMPYASDNDIQSEAAPVVSIWNRFFGCAAPLDDVEVLGSPSNTPNRHNSSWWNFRKGDGSCAAVEVSPGTHGPRCKEGPVPAKATKEAVNPEDFLLEDRTDQEARTNGPKRSQSYKLTLETFEKETLHPSPPVDTLDLRPTDMKPYRGQPLPF